MAKKISISKNIQEIRNALKKNNLIIGTDKTVKMLKQGKVDKVFVTINCPKQIIEDLNNYTRISKVKLSELNYTNTELGVFCKKQFAISVVSIPKGA